MVTAQKEDYQVTQILLKNPIPMLVFTHILENDVRVKGKMKNYANIRHTKVLPLWGMNSLIDK